LSLVCAYAEYHRRLELRFEKAHRLSVALGKLHLGAIATALGRRSNVENKLIVAEELPFPTSMKGLITA